MNYTEKYHLPQWVKTDRIMMEDFNQMCADMEAGLVSNREAARQEAEEAAKLPYVIGTYSGRGEEQTIELGFRPTFLIIASNNENGYGFKGGIFGKDVTTSRLKFTDTGFTVKTHGNTNYYPMVNCSGYFFVYIAFR